MKSESYINTSRSKNALTVFIFLFTSVFYLSTLSNGFVYDDNFVVMANPLIRESGHLSDYFFDNVWSFFAEDSKANFYRPLQLVLYRFEYALFGLNPWPWHLVNLLLHSLSAALVFLLARKLLPPMEGDSLGRDLPGRALTPIIRAAPAVFAALIFALHPVNVEPVSWVSSVSDLLFVFFFLLGLYFYISSSGGGVEGRGNFRLRIFSLFAYLLLSKI